MQSHQEALEEQTSQAISEEKARMVQEAVGALQHEKNEANSTSGRVRSSIGREPGEYK